MVGLRSSLFEVFTIIARWQEDAINVLRFIITILYESNNIYRIWLDQDWVLGVNKNNKQFLRIQINYLNFLFSFLSESLPILRTIYPFPWPQSILFMHANMYRAMSVYHLLHSSAWNQDRVIAVTKSPPALPPEAFSQSAGCRPECRQLDCSTPDAPAKHAETTDSLANEMTKRDLLCKR